MDAAGPWKAVDVFEEQQERTRPHLPTALGKPAQRTAGFPQRPQAGKTDRSSTTDLLRRPNHTKKDTSHVGDPGGECS
jgi:hypothetical protein